MNRLTKFQDISGVFQLKQIWFFQGQKFVFPALTHVPLMVVFEEFALIYRPHS